MKSMDATSRQCFSASFIDIVNRDYGRGYSERNLRDMQRFFEGFVIRQAVSAESSPALVIWQAASAESQIQPIPQTPSRESLPSAILPALSAESSTADVRQPSDAKIKTVQALSEESRLEIDFSRHYHLGWSQAARRELWGEISRRGAGTQRMNPHPTTVLSLHTLSASAGKP